MIQFRRVKRDLKKLVELNSKHEMEKCKRELRKMKKSYSRALNLYAKEIYVHRRGEFESGRAALTLCASRRWLSNQELSHVLVLNSNVRKNVWAMLDDDFSSVGSRLSEKRLWSPAKVRRSETVSSSHDELHTTNNTGTTLSIAHTRRKTRSSIEKMYQTNGNDGGIVEKRTTSK